MIDLPPDMEWGAQSTETLLLPCGWHTHNLIESSLPLLALIGRKLRLCGVELLSWSSPATEFEPKTFCSTASILPFHACTSISAHQVIYFSWPYFAILFSGCLSFSLCTWSKSVYPSKSSLNLVLPVIISPKHLSQNRAELASPNKN